MAAARAQNSTQNQALRRFTASVLLEYRRTGNSASNENLKHVRRMAREVRRDFESLTRIGCDASVLEAAILLSDLGKEPHILSRYLHEYGGNSFRAFLDHSRISMREGNRMRKEAGLDHRTWRKIIRSIIGHDGPSIPGSWWKINYERELGKAYPGIHSRDALIHAYLDRIDQGGLFRTRSGQINGGLRKISYDIYLKPGPFMGNFAGTIGEVFTNTRVGTQEQIDYLDEVIKPKLLGSEQLPKIVREMKRKFIESESYFERVLLDSADPGRVRIVLDDGSNIAVESLDEFWLVLSRVNLKGAFAGERRTRIA